MSAKQGYHGTLYQQKKSIPVLRAFMDDVSLMTTSTPASKIALQRTVVALSQNETKAPEIRWTSDKRRKRHRSITISSFWGDHSIYPKGTIENFGKSLQ